MASEYSVVTGSVVSVNVTSPNNKFGVERRYPKEICIAELKGKLELVTGCTTVNMKLEVQDKDGRPVCKLDNNDAMLGSYPVDDGMIINVTDPTVTCGEFEDVSKVEKYEMNEDEYAKRSDSLRAYKMRNKLGEFQEVDEEKAEKLRLKKEEKEREEKDAAESMVVGSRCQVAVTGQPTKRGMVQFVGKTDFKPGYWVGVQYDEPLGKNNGSVGGRQYFECPDKYGAFVKIGSVEIGNFPEEGLSDDEM